MTYIVYKYHGEGYDYSQLHQTCDDVYDKVVNASDDFSHYRKLLRSFIRVFWLVPVRV